MLVDDEAAYARLLGDMLGESLSCPVHVFSRPVDALARIQELNAAIVVTDYSMPELNGLEFIRRAEKIVPHASFLLITGQLIDVEDECWQSIPGFKGMLPKPFSWRTLATEILRHWEDDPLPVRTASGVSEI